MSQKESIWTDTNTWERIKKKPTEKKKKTVKDLQKPPLQDKKITQEAFDYLTPKASITLKYMVL